MNKKCSLLSILLCHLLFLLSLLGKKSAKGVWKVLEKRFASVSRSHVISLRSELSAVEKGTGTIVVISKRSSKS